MKAVPMKIPLIWKLLAVHLVVIGFVMAIVWFAIDTLAAGYFVTLMERYHISPEPAHAMFVGAIHRYLVWACVGALGLAATLSFIMMRRVLSPMTKMTAIAGRIAGGDFKGRVPVASGDEVGQLASAFNRMAQSLEALENLRRNLMIDVAHELRTPLTNMRGYLEALEDGVLPPAHETISMLHGETLRLADLVEDVLHLARADAAKTKGGLDREPTDLSALLREMTQAIQPQMDEKNIALDTGDLAPLPEVSADPHRMRRIIRNLLDNAVRYAPEGGRISIRSETSAGHVRVTFSNPYTGEINPEDLPFWFERFFRGEKSRSREHGGAGIGLSIVKELVEAHGGQVGVDLGQERVYIWFELPVG